MDSVNKDTEYAEKVPPKGVYRKGNGEPSAGAEEEIMVLDNNASSK